LIFFILKIDTIHKNPTQIIKTPAYAITQTG